MSIQVPAQRIRFAIDVSKWPAGLGSAPVDIISGLTAQIANGADLQIEMMFSDGALVDANVVDFTNIASVTIALMSQTNPHGSTIYWSLTVPNGSIVNDVTVAEWTNAQPNTNAQITAIIADGLNSLNLSAATSAPYWLCIYGTTTDATPKQVPYAFFPISIIDTGMPVSNPVIPSPFKVGTKLSFVCSDGLTRDVTLQTNGAGIWSVNINQVGYNGGGQASFALLCSDTFYRNISVVIQQGIWTLDVSQAGHS